MSSNMQDIINPYVLIPPDTKKQIYFEKEELNFKILLLGEGVQYARQLVNAIQQIGKLGLGASRYKFELMKITHSLDQRIIWEKGHFYEIAIRSAALPYLACRMFRSYIFKCYAPAHTPQWKSA